jgi:hypothetical protein
LALLAAGQITYADYAMLVDFDLAQSAAMTKAATDQAAQLEQAARQQAEQRSVIALSCIVHTDGSDPQMQVMNGVEFQFSIDPVHLTASASRGAGPPTNVEVSPTLISFRQGNLNVAISRATGRFTEAANDNTVAFAVSGTCEPIRAAKF